MPDPARGTATLYDSETFGSPVVPSCAQRTLLWRKAGCMRARRPWIYRLILLLMLVPTGAESHMWCHYVSPKLI